ncbi:hypothetical protein [Streptomyces sp. UG1]|uniref:hypothetical protein n=1 Tax=Streptomyces sp. UG1 TaxID=3417652 RepID=UPI003CF8E4A6
MTTATLYAWINRGWIATRRESCWPHRLIAHVDQPELAELRERRTRPTSHLRGRTTKPAVLSVRLTIVTVSRRTVLAQATRRPA